MSILVVGSVALDTIRTSSSAVEEALGGSASYFSVAARHFDAVSLLAVVGEDFPNQHVDLFREMKIDVSGLKRAPGQTFRWSGEYSADFNSRTTLDTQLNVFSDFNPELSPEHKNAEFLFLANIHPDLQGSVLDQMNSPRLVVLDTMNYWIERTRENLLKTIKRVDMVLINDEEARMISGESNAVGAAKGVLDLGPSVVVIKRGEHGATVFSKEFTFIAPAYPLKHVIDPTGAGDTFAGGFLGYLASSEDHRKQEEVRRAAIYGSVLASFAVESFSVSRLASATREEIELRFTDVKEMVRF